MENTCFKYSFKTTGIERKTIASTLAQSLGETAKYAGTPTYAYEVGGWFIDRQGNLTTPELPIDQKGSLRQVLDALKEAGVTTEGNGTVVVTFGDHTINTLRNLTNLIRSKQSLIRKAFNRQDAIIPENFLTAFNSSIDSLEDFGGTKNTEVQENSGLAFNLDNKTIQFSFFNSILGADEVLAFITLCWQINEQAKKQKIASGLEKETENDKYTFRVWLLKIGFIGEAFKEERKVLLSRLSGNAAFRTEEARLAADDKRKAKLAEGSANQ